MRNYFIILIICLFTFSCAKRDNCNNLVPLVGKYENIYDKDATNILIIKADGTFEQIFTKGKIVQKNKGTYRFFTDDCTLYLDGLKILHNLPRQYSEYKVEDKFPAKFRNNNVIFIEGLAYEFDYYRIDE
jgi:hypothetical protein